MWIVVIVLGFPGFDDVVLFSHFDSLCVMVLGSLVEIYVFFSLIVGLFVILKV